MKRAVFVVLSLFLCSSAAFEQDSTLYKSDDGGNKTRFLTGFIRGGLYSWIDNTDKKAYVSSAFSDLGLKLESGNGQNLRAYADLRFRYGSEFLDPVNRFDIREAFLTVNSKKWDLSVGQKIIKWGRCDFTNPTSRISPQNMVSRSPDREDIDIGNLLSSFNFFPSEHVSLQAVLVPLHRSSTLVIDPFPLPDNVVLNKITSLQTGKETFSYGLKADFFMKQIDWSLSWFDGFDPMPGIALIKFEVIPAQTQLLTNTILSEKAYRDRVLGVDFETTAGAFGFRGEAAWSNPVLSHNINEYVPLPEIKWVAGTDWSSGTWRLTAEYSGKYVMDFTPVSVVPLIGSEPDYTRLAGLLAVPGFNPEDYVRDQVGAFNRLYNYQIKRYYHSAALRAETELLYGKLIPSFFAMYNFTSGDFLAIPEVKIRPSDGLAFTAGLEIYSGRSDSLYDLIDGFMNSFYVSLRVDF